MRVSIRWGHFAMASLVATLCLGASAAPVVYYGDDPGAQLTVPVGGGSVTAKGAFLSQLVPSSVKTETFEGFARGTTAPASAPLSVFGGDARLVASGSGAGARIENIVSITNPDGSVSTPGRFNTTPGGANWWQSSIPFTITFNQAISAFGFFGTDFAEFGGSLSLELLSSAGDVLQTLIVKEQPVVTPTVGPDVNGSLLFFGFTDAAQAYSGIRFVVGQSGGPISDVLGFDDIVIGAIGTGPGTVPEPTTLALVAACLGGLAISRRRTIATR
jgi:hypothetical protein